MSSAKSYKECPRCEFSNPRCANYCMECGHPFIQANFDTLRFLTIFFLDIEGYSALSSDLNPDEIKELLQECYELFESIIRSEKGKVLKYEGDAVMAAFGLHDDTDQSPFLACYAALRIQDSFQAHCRERALPTMTLRIGLHCGKVLVSNIGGITDLIGASVNRAKRMEQNAPTGGILISPELHQLVVDRFEFKSVGEIKIKGFSKPVRPYQLKGRKSRSKRSILGRQIPTVGRNKEISQIMSKMRDSFEKRHSFLVLIESGPGLGKSQLLRESMTRARELGYDPILSFCNFNSTVAHNCHALRILCYALGIHGMEDLHRKLDSLSFEEREELGYLIGFQGSMSPIALDEVNYKDRFHSFVKWLGTELRRPVLFVIDDMHWADLGSLNFIDELMQFREVPVFVLASGRNRRREADFFFSSQNGQGIRLSCLTPTESKQLLRECLGHLDSVDGELIDELSRLSQGNPLFIEELVLHYANFCLQKDGSESQNLELPSSLELVIQNRVDQLPRALTLMLMKAGVQGKIFFPDALGELEESLLEDARERGLIVQLKDHPKTGWRQYQFSHEMIRISLIHRLTQKELGKVHRDLANYFEKGVEDNHLLAESVAWHSHMAGLHEKALIWYSRAIRIYGGMSQIECICDLATKALELPDEVLKSRTKEVFVILDAMGEAVELSGGYDHYLEQIAYWLPYLECESQQLCLKIKSLRTSLLAHDYRRFLNNLPIFKEELERGSVFTPRVVQEYEFLLAEYQRIKGSLSESRAIFEKILQDGKAECLVLSNAYNALAKLHHSHGDTLQACRVQLEGIRYCREKKYVRGLGMGLNNLGFFLKALGKEKWALSSIQRAYQLKRTVFDYPGQIICLVNELFMSKNLETALSTLQNALTLCNNLKLGRETHLVELMLMHLEEGRMDEIRLSEIRDWFFQRECKDQYDQFLQATQELQSRLKAA